MRVGMFVLWDWCEKRLQFVGAVIRACMNFADLLNVPVMANL